jgi:hypothetical protein
VELRRSAYCFLNPTAVRTSVYASPGGVPRGTSGLRPSRAVEPHEGRASAVFDVKRELHKPAAVHLRSWFHVEHGFRLPYRILTPPIILFHGERNRCARTEGAIRRRRVKRIAGEFLAAHVRSTWNTAACSSAPEVVQVILLMFHVEPSRARERVREPRSSFGRPA